MDYFDSLRELFTQNYNSYAKELQFEVIIIFFVVILFMVKFFPTNAHIIVIVIVFVALLAGYWVSYKNSRLDDFNKQTMFKLNKIQETSDKTLDKIIKRRTSGKIRLSKQEITKEFANSRLSSMYIDANMINFIYSIVDLSTFNDLEFYTFLKGVNNILRLVKESDEYYQKNGKILSNISQMLEDAVVLKTSTINNLHNFIYTIPKSHKLYKYLQQVTNRYNVLITRNVDILHEHYILAIRENGLTSSSKLVDYNVTKAYERQTNHSAILDKTEKSKLISFYV